MSNLKHDYLLADQEEQLGPKLTPPHKWTWEAIDEMTGGLKDVPNQAILGGRIDHEYRCKTWGSCGRKSCRKSHGWGFIVAIAGRRYVNIGHNCRDKYASPEWDRMVKDFRDRQGAEYQAKAIAQLLLDAKSKLGWHRSIEVDVLGRTNLRNSFRQQLQGGVLTEIERRANKRDPRVVHEVSISAAMQDAKRAMLGGGRVDKVEENIRVSRFETRHIGDLVGLEIFVPMKDPLSLWKRFGTLLTTIIDSEPLLEDPDVLRAMIKAGRDLVPWGNDILASIAATDQFFSEKNLRVVSEMLSARTLDIEQIAVANGNEVVVMRK